MMCTASASARRRLPTRSPPRRQSLSLHAMACPISYAFGPLPPIHFLIAASRTPPAPPPRRTRRHTARAIARDKASPPRAPNASCVLQPSQRSLQNLARRAQLLFEVTLAVRRKAIRLPAVLRFHLLDPALLHQPGDCAIKRSRPQPHPGKLLDVLHHGVPVLLASRQAGQNQQRRLYHILRITVYRIT